MNEYRDGLIDDRRTHIQDRAEQLDANINDIVEFFKLSWPKTTTQAMCSLITKLSSTYHIYREGDLLTIGLLVIASNPDSMGHVLPENNGIGLSSVVYALDAKTPLLTEIRNYYADQQNLTIEKILLLYALEIGTRMFNGEGEELGFEGVSFDTSKYLALCDSLKEKVDNEMLYLKIVSLIKLIDEIKRGPGKQIRYPGYQESHILTDCVPNGYILIRTLLNRALNAVDHSFEPYTAPKHQPYRAQQEKFMGKLSVLKSVILHEYRNASFETDAAASLAQSIHILADRVGKMGVRQQDIDAFIQESNPYRSSSTIALWLDKLVYVAIALLALVCGATAAAAAAGAGVLGMTLTGTAGLGLGLLAKQMFWQSNALPQPGQKGYAITHGIDDLVLQAQPLLGLK